MSLPLSLPSVYPRVCGGTINFERPDGSFYGLSPRVRGDLAAKVVPPFCSGSIPACAGEPKVFEPGGETEAVYPRVCGGTAGTTVGYGNNAGLSPRVRGNPGRSIPLPRTNRSIPACAGEPTHR